MADDATDLVARLGAGIRDLMSGDGPIKATTQSTGAAALVAIAEELRTANLLAAAALFEQSPDREEIGWQSRVEAAERLGYPTPTRPTAYDVMRNS